ncbi:MAG: M48 family metallopeptidase [Flavobacteriales bacterium]
MDNSGKGKYILFVSLLLSSFFLPAQVVDFNHYQNIECNGEIPKVIIKTMDKRIAEEEKKEISKKDNWREKKKKEKFIIESSYGISELLVSGAVVFNDSLSLYITGVAKELLKNDPETFSKMHFFAVKAPYINAFSTHEGVVLINIGLIAQLETEAQLAFILAHEIAHFKKKHVLNPYIENKSNHNRNAYNVQQEQENILKQENYSKEFEMEADELGMEILQQSSYSLESISAVFDLLQYSSLRKQIPFDPKFFNTPNLTIPSSYFLKKVNELKEHDNNSSTHPNISQRRNNVLSKVASWSNKDRKDFIHPQSRFELIRDIASFELISIYITYRKYEMAIYHAYTLLQKYPESEFLYSAIGNALYFLSKYYNSSILSDVTASYINVEGEAQQVHFFIQNLSKADLNVIACEFLWRQYFKYPYRQDIKKKADELLNELVRLHYPGGKDFSEQAKEITADTVLFVAEKNTKTKQPEKEKIITRYAFVDLFKEAEFRIAYQNAFVYKDTNVIISKNYYSEQLIQYNPRTFKHLNISRLVMVDPGYYKINNVSGTNEFDPVRSEEARREYSMMIKSIGKKANVDVVLLDSKFLNAKQVSTFNEISRLNAFINELYIHRNLDSMLSTDYQLTQLLLQKHNTKYLGWNSIFSITEADAMSDPYLFNMYSYYMPLLIPFYIGDAATPDYFTYHYILVADIEKGKIIFNNSYKIDGRDSEDKLKSNLYYNFLQIGGKKKK